MLEVHVGVYTTMVVYSSDHRTVEVNRYKTEFCEGLTPKLDCPLMTASLSEGPKKSQG